MWVRHLLSAKVKYQQTSDEIMEIDQSYSKCQKKENGQLRSTKVYLCSVLHIQDCLFSGQEGTLFFLFSFFVLRKGVLAGEQQTRISFMQIMCYMEDADGSTTEWWLWRRVMVRNMVPITLSTSDTAASLSPNAVCNMIYVLCSYYVCVHGLEAHKHIISEIQNTVV